MAALSPNYTQNLSKSHSVFSCTTSSSGEFWLPEGVDGIGIAFLILVYLGAVHETFYFIVLIVLEFPFPGVS